MAVDYTADYCALSEAPALQARLDARLQTLWNPQLSVALVAAEAIYAPDADAGMVRREVEEWMCGRFWRLLLERYPHAPGMPAERYRAVVETIDQLQQAARAAVTIPFVEEYIAVALRPIRRLCLGSLTREVCAALIDFDRGVWTPHLTKSQLYVIEMALARTVAGLPPARMDDFWCGLSSSDPVVHGAMRLGLRYLRSAHAAPHLLHGLQQVSDHTTRAAIVDCLEQIAEPSVISTLMRLRRETAATDWALSRQIARAIRVIEQQNRGQSHRTLLRPASTPADDPALLRPLDAVSAAKVDGRHLLRSFTEAADRE